MKTHRGFTLIEVLMAAGILACGLVAVAAIFSFVIRANIMNRQMAVAASLLRDRMEEFRAASLTDPIWTNTAGSETLFVAGDRFSRAWEIGTTMPRSVTIIVYSENNALTRRRAELIRATTLVGPTF